MGDTQVLIALAVIGTLVGVIPGVVIIVAVALMGLIDE